MHIDSYSNQSEMIVLPLSRLCFHPTVITNIQYKPMNIILTLHRFLPAGGQPVCCRRVNSGGLTVWFIWCLGRCPVGRQGRGFFLAFKTNVWYIYLWWALPQIMFLGVNYVYCIWVSKRIRYYLKPVHELEVYLYYVSLIWLKVRNKVRKHRIIYPIGP